MGQSERQKLEQEAQNMLVEARRLIKEAGKLAKQGQFVLDFGEIGTFIPKRYADPELYREEAIEQLKAEGWERYDRDKKENVVTDWAQLEADPELFDQALNERIESIIECLDVPWEYREYGGTEGEDDWWHPSRC